MYTCILCKYPTELDDAVAGGESGRCICLRCFHREVGDVRRLSPALRRSIEAVAAEAAEIGGW